jgi:hypothetical protein
MKELNQAQRRVNRYIHFTKEHAKQSGLVIEGRIVVIDKETGMKFE